jgi:hypothetical protein
MAKEKGVEVTLDKTKQVGDAIQQLAKARLLVGIPQSSAGRDAGKLNNAELGYIHENGSPEAHIPARPFLHTGVRKVQDSVTVPGFEKAGRQAMSGDWAGAERTLSIVGQKAVDSIKDTLTAGIPPPLRPGTIAGRLRRTAAYGKAGPQKRAQLRQRAAGDAKPLIDTGQLLRAITWVLRKG